MRQTVLWEFDTDHAVRKNRFQRSLIAGTMTDLQLVLRPVLYPVYHSRPFMTDEPVTHL